METSPPVIMTVATTDSGGGAGIQADLKTMTVLGGFGVSVAVALTAQHGAAVKGIYEIPPEFSVLQLETVLEGFPVKAAKTGMLFSSAIMEAVAPIFATFEFPLVVDPVCVSQSGYKLMRDDAVETMKKVIIPHATLLTPNMPEAETLSGMPVNTLSQMEKAAKRLIEMGAGAVLMKGGHREEDDPNVITDWLCVGSGELKPLPHKRVQTLNNHGTGCTLSAAIATFLGLGFSLEDSIIRAQAFLSRALEASFTPGLGPGCPNFLGGVLA